MTRRNKEVARNDLAPVLDVALLANVRQLNCDYLDLLLTNTEAVQHAAESLPPKLRDELAHLPDAARSHLAATPYSLYSLEFEDQQFWYTALDSSKPAATPADSTEDRYAVASATSSTVFCEVALFFCWHAAVLNPVAARMLFAMPDALVERIVQVPLWKLRRIAADFPGLLRPRWPTNPGFWPDLLRFTAAGDLRRLQTTQLLGSHLIAAELEGATGGGVFGGRARRIGFTRR